MKSNGSAYATQAMPKSNNQKVVLDDIYVTLYEIRGIIYKAKEENIDMTKWITIVDEFESRLFHDINNSKRNLFADLFIEANNIKNEMYIYYYRNSKTKPNFDNNKDLDTQYNDLYRKMSQNNLKVEKSYNQLSNEKDDIKENNSIKKILIPSLDEASWFAVGIPFALATLVPINVKQTNIYSSQTQQIQEESQSGYRAFQLLNDKKIIKVYEKLKDETKEIEYEIERDTTFDDAIKLGEELLRDYKNDNLITDNNRIYYEVIYIKRKPYSLLFLLSLILTISAGCIIEKKPGFGEGLLITRIIENLKANIIYKKDLMELLELAKEMKEENEKIANELYSIIINNPKENFDLLFEKIESQRNKPDEYIELTKKL